MSRAEDAGTGAGPGEHVGPLLDAYRTRELEAAAMAAVDAHLEACARCREELAALGPWAAVIERGYAALRAEGREPEPDWAAQRAAVVARTSGRRSRPREGWAFRRWAPQVALVAVAALIVGVVWRDRAREPGEETVATTSESIAPGEESAADDGGVAPAEIPQAAAPPAAAPRADARERAGADQPALAEDVRLEAEAKVEGQDRAQGQEMLAGRAAVFQPAESARFAREARAALGARDTAAARRALVLWSDTLAPAEADSQAALADSLRELLAPE